MIEVKMTFPHLRAACAAVLALEGGEVVSFTPRDEDAHLARLSDAMPLPPATGSQSVAVQVPIAAPETAAEPVAAARTTRRSKAQMAADEAAAKLIAEATAARAGVPDLSGEPTASGAEAEPVSSSVPEAIPETAPASDGGATSTAPTVAADFAAEVEAAATAAGAGAVELTKEEAADFYALQIRPATTAVMGAVGQDKCREFLERFLSLPPDDPEPAHIKRIPPRRYAEYMAQARELAGDEKVDKLIAVAKAKAEG